MRKIFNIVLLVFSVFIVGCSDEDDSTTLEMLKVVKSDVAFQAVGGAGSIRVQAGMPISAESGADWCKITEVENNTVVLLVAANTGYPSRSTQITIADGVNKQMVTVTQEGAVFIYNEAEQELVVGDAPATIPIELSGSLPCTVEIPESAKDWLSYKATSNEGGEFILTANTTKMLRGAIVNVKSGVRTVTYSILQYEIDDMVGDWRGQFIYQNQPVGFDKITISKNVNNTYAISGFLSEVPEYTMKAIGANGILSISCGQALGRASGYYDVLCFLGSAGITFDKKYTMGLYPGLLQDGTVALVFDANAGSPSGFNGFTVSAFRTATPSGTALWHIGVFYSPIILYK